MFYVILPTITTDYIRAELAGLGIGRLSIGPVSVRAAIVATVTVDFKFTIKCHVQIKYFRQEHENPLNRFRYLEILRHLHQSARKKKPDMLVKQGVGIVLRQYPYVFFASHSRFLY